METSQLIFCANQLTGFYMRETLALSGLNLLRPNMFYPSPVKPWMVRAEKQERTKTVLKKK